MKMEIWVPIFRDRRPGNQSLACSYVTYLNNLAVAKSDIKSGYVIDWTRLKRLSVPCIMSDKMTTWFLTATWQYLALKVYITIVFRKSTATHIFHSATISLLWGYPAAARRLKILVQVVINLNSILNRKASYLVFLVISKS